MCNTAKAEVQKRLIGLAFLDHVNKGWSAASFRVPIAQWWKVGQPGMEWLRGASKRIKYLQKTWGSRDKLRFVSKRLLHSLPSCIKQVECLNAS